MKESTFPPQLIFTPIAERIIVVMFASEDHETTYVSSITDVAQMLLKKHGENYLVVNLSDRRNDMHKMHRQVIDFGWPETLAPPLERLCNICKCIDSYLNGNQKNVVVIHCKGGLGRLAVVLSAYIDYSNICSSDIQNLDQFSMKNFYDNKLAGCTHPSQRRYVHYFAGLLSGGISINNNPLFLHQIVIRGVPNFDGKGGCCPYIKIYQGMKPVYVSGVFSSSSNLNQIIVTLDPCLQLRSDILVKCYNKSSNSSANREMIFRCQFHTCAVNNNNSLKFGKTDLDEACQDSRFPSHGQVEFVLSESIHNWNKYEISDTERNILIGNSPESIERWNSYENFAGPLEDITFETMNSHSNANRRADKYEEFYRTADNNNNEFASTSYSTSAARKRQEDRNDYSPSRRYVETNNNWANGNVVEQDFESLRMNDRAGNTSTNTKEYRDAKGRKCQTIETETFSRRCETTTSQFANDNQAGNTMPKQLMPPPRSSTPSTPVIPERGEASREAYVRNTYSLKPIGDYTFEADTRSHASLPRLEHPQPIEVEIVSLQPIGPGVQTLEPTTPNTGTIMRATTPGPGTLSREYNAVTNSVSVPNSLATLQPSPTNLRPPSANQMRTFSRNESYQTTVKPVPVYQQKVSTMDSSRMNSVNNGPLPLLPYQSATLPQQFSTLQQPYVQSYKETQTWSTTHNPSANAPASAGSTIQRQQPPRIGGSVQHLNQNQTMHRTMSSSAESRSIPVLVQHQDGTLTAPINNNAAVPSIHLQRQATLQEQQRQQQLMQHSMLQQQQPQGFVQQQSIKQQYVQQQQQPVVQHRSRDEVDSEVIALNSGNATFMTGSQSATSSNVRRFQSQASGAVLNEGGTMVNRSRAGSFSSAAATGAGADYEFVSTSTKFVKDTSKYWHRQNFTRDDAIQYLKDKPAGSFVIRNSATYPGAYGLTLKVSQVPDNVPLTTGDPQLELVRHFIIEPTAKGVQLKGSPVEPVFASLSAFVYQHTITPLSLPCQLVLPNIDDVFEDQSTAVVGSSSAFSSSSKADCNVLYIDSLDMESLTGPDALQKALDVIFAKGSALPKTILVNIAASSQGITVTDNERRKFFRYSYPLNSITYLGLDNQEDKWKVADYDGQARACGRVFGFVAKKSVGGTDNVCHMFAELDARQNPAQTLIEFITAIMKNEGRQVTRT